MARVGLVVDSTCDVEPSWLEQHDVVMVPLTVLFGEEPFRDWIDLRPTEFYERLKASPSLPTTSQPSPAAFSAAYQSLVDSGAEEIVSIHLSAPLSGTFESAMIAAKDAPIPVHVIDTKLVSQGVALVAFAAIEARDRGEDGEAVAAVARSTAEKTRLLFLLDTLDYLVKGGRAGKAQGLAASVLNIKPVLEVNKDGIVEPLKKVRGQQQALAALVQIVAEDAAKLGRLKVAVLHACSPIRAQQLTAALQSTGADIEVVTTGLVGAVIGTYAGPDAVGVAYHPV